TTSISLSLFNQAVPLSHSLRLQTKGKHHRLSINRNDTIKMDSKTASTGDVVSSTTNKLNQMESPEDLDVFVKELMDNMQTRFSRLSDTILGRIDDMGSKIDDLEKTISELMDQAGIEPTASIEGGAKPKV
ncbi:hypothetical protein ACHAW6_011083, partial [Cyclotella cf. meneghiniana]